MKVFIAFLVSFWLAALHIVILTTFSEASDKNDILVRVLKAVKGYHSILR